MTNRKRTKLNRDRNDKFTEQYRPWANRNNMRKLNTNKYPDFTPKPGFNQPNKVQKNDTNIRPLMDIQTRSPKQGAWQRRSTFVNQKFHYSKPSRPTPSHILEHTPANLISSTNTNNIRDRPEQNPEGQATSFSTPTNKTQRDLIKIRSTIIRLHKEYAEEFPESNNTIGDFNVKNSDQLLTSYNLSSPPSFLPLDLTILTIHDISHEPHILPPVSPNLNALSTEMPLITVDNTLAGSVAMVPFLEHVLNFQTGSSLEENK